MQSTGADSFAGSDFSPARPSSRSGERGMGMGMGMVSSRAGGGDAAGPKVNRPAPTGSLFSDPEDMIYDSSPSRFQPAASTSIGSAEKSLARMNISAVFDPTASSAAASPATVTRKLAGGMSSPVAARVDTSDLRSFLTRVAPRDQTVQCYIVREKTGKKRLYPVYKLYLQENDKFLLSAKKRKNQKKTNYLVSLDEEDLTKDSGNYFGKLRANFVGTEFTMYDKGPSREKSAPRSLRRALFNDTGQPRVTVWLR